MLLYIGDITAGLCSQDKLVVMQMTMSDLSSYRKFRPESIDMWDKNIFRRQSSVSNISDKYCARKESLMVRRVS